MARFRSRGTVKGSRNAFEAVPELRREWTLAKGDPRGARRLADGRANEQRQDLFWITDNRGGRRDGVLGTFRQFRRVFQICRRRRRLVSAAEVDPWREGRGAGAAAAKRSGS